jgi:hypothetical protein
VLNGVDDIYLCVEDVDDIYLCIDGVDHAVACVISYSAEGGATEVTLVQMFLVLLVRFL